MGLKTHSRAVGNDSLLCALYAAHSRYKAYPAHTRPATGNACKWRTVPTCAISTERMIHTADVTVATFKQGDRFAFFYTPTPAMIGKADTMVAEVREEPDFPLLATLTITESQSTPGTYWMHTDADTSEWPESVKVDVWHSDLMMHDADTLVFLFGGSITDA